MKMRKVFNKLLKQRNNNKISILIGPRQVGKTTLLTMIKTHFENKNEKVFYFDLERLTDLEIWGQPVEKIVKEFPEENVIILLDDFYHLPHANKTLKVIHDHYPHLKIYASGSSSIEIQKHLSESLAGRKFINIIYPLSLFEFIESETTDPDPAHSKHKKWLDRLNRFLIFGGMPGQIQTESDEETRESLHEYIEAYLQKDIRNLLTDQNVLAYNNLLKLIASQIGNLFNKNELSNTLNIGANSLNHYISTLTGTYNLYLLPPFVTNKRKEVSKQPKCYLFDNGIRNQLLNNFTDIDLRPDKGSLLENFVFLELKKSLTVMHELYYWRTQQQVEVDFILRKDQTIIPIEVKSGLKSLTIPSNMKSFINHYPEVTQGYILNLNLFGRVKYNKTTIDFIPVYIAGKLIDF